jgi:hypothetical protein
MGCTTPVRRRPFFLDASASRSRATADPTVQTHHPLSEL